MLLINRPKTIRFIFILDESTPNFSNTSKFYVDQLKKNMIMNIYKDGEWGTIMKNIVENLNSNIQLDYNISTQINTLKLNDLSVKYFGINFDDITVNYDNDNELGCMEYSGVTINNNLIMGIASFEKNTLNIISPDPYLSWVIPSDWSLEDAATVPLSYSLAYYILKVLITSIDEYTENSILVHAGFNAVGQALIAIALADNYTVYTTVENDEQSILLRKRFPSLPKSRIFSYKTINFEVQIKMATKGRGVSIVVNCLSGDEFHASLRSLAIFGNFFQLSKVDMKQKSKLGLLIFMKVIALYGVSSLSMLEESSDNKQRIQNAVQKGIELGIVRPFDRRILTGPYTKNLALEALKLSSQEVESKRVVLSLEGEKIFNKSNHVSGYEIYQCFSNKSYLIVGGKYNSWIDLAKWLVIRGARKIIVSINKYAMSSTASRRISLLLSRYENVMIQIVSDSYLNSKEDLTLLLKDTTATAPLDGIFVATMSEENDQLRNIQYAFENLSFLRDAKPTFIICIMSGGDEICAELRSKSICSNAISISCNTTATDLKFSNLVSILDRVLLNVDSISSSTIICTEYNKQLLVSRDVSSKFNAVLPESIDELNAFGDSISEEPEFIEVITNSPRFSDTLEGLPVFIVTGFLTKHMNKLYANLMYPTFEARLPETIDSIELVARQLVQKLKAITKCGTVSLIGVSWGGVICLLMAQMLEAENIAISLTLLEGIPEVIQEWASSMRQYGNFNSKLVSNYFQINNMVAKELATSHGWSKELSKVLSSNNVSNADKTFKALNAIRSRLNAIFTIQPLTNKIIAKVQIINRSINNDKSSISNLTNYCEYIPEKFTLDENDYEQMLSLRKLGQIINNNIIHYHPDAMELSIQDVYAHSERNTIGFVIA